jgi:hypothetical protein
VLLSTLLGRRSDFRQTATCSRVALDLKQKRLSLTTEGPNQGPLAPLQLCSPGSGRRPRRFRSGQEAQHSRQEGARRLSFALFPNPQLINRMIATCYIKDLIAGMWPDHPSSRNAL